MDVKLTLQMFNHIHGSGSGSAIRLCHDLRGCEAKRTFWFWIRNPKSKKRDGKDIIRKIVVFELVACCWDDNFELGLVSLMTIWCLIVAGKTIELEGHDLHAWLRGIVFFWRSSEFLAPNERWLSNRTIRDIAPLKQYKFNSKETERLRLFFLRVILSQFVPVVYYTKLIVTKLYPYIDEGTLPGAKSAYCYSF